MVSKSLRNRTVGTDDNSSAAGEYDHGYPHAQPDEFNSETELEVDSNRQTSVEVETVTKVLSVGVATTRSNNDNNTDQLQRMFAEMCVRLQENTESKLSSFQENNVKLQTQLREDIKTANEELIKRLEAVDNKLEQENLAVDDLTSKVIEQGTDMDTNFKKVESKIVRMDKEINNVKEVVVEMQDTTSAKQSNYYGSEMGEMR
jgi:hypothetical protein